METVNFQCGHCGKLMGVSTEFLGQQVRCPHCQGVVVAPSATVPAATDPSDTVAFESKSDAEHDSIFSPPDAGSEDVFGRDLSPRPEMPADATELLLNVPAPTTPSAPQPQPNLEMTQPFFPNTEPSPAASAQTEAITASDATPAWMSNGPGDATTILDEQPAPTGNMPMGAPTSVVRPSRRPASTAGLLTFIIIFSLVSYSVLATVYIILLLNNRKDPYPLLEFMPDNTGDNPGVKKSEGRILGPEQTRELNRKQLPDQLRVGLGKTLRVGDLEIKPIKVEVRTVGVKDENHEKAEPCPNESVVLTLELRNLATDYRFSPLDNYFDRKWEHFNDPKRNRAGPEPMTFLQIGKKPFFGGPAEWVPRKRRAASKIDRQWVDLPGRKNFDDDGLAPGATVLTTVCTDGYDPAVVNALENHDEKRDGKLIYRVLVRRGLVTVGDNKRVAATAVIGVEFTREDVRP
jgi:hypothetical protein